MARSVFELTKEQKDEIRRLTQLANRRIKAFTKEFEKGGLTIAPYEPTGGIQMRDQWHTPKTPVSRSVRFATEEEYKEKIYWLRKFENPILRPNLTQYTKSEREKTKQAIVSALGNITEEQERLIDGMSAFELAIFWDIFERNARDLFIEYSSDAAMYATLEYYNEDIEGLNYRTKKEFKDKTGG